MIQIWVDEVTGRVEISVRGGTIRLSASEAIRLRDGLKELINE